MTLDRSRLDGYVDANAQTLIDVAHKIHAHPELKFAEHQASAWLFDAACLEGVSAERNAGGLATSFRARFGSGAHPRVAILAEYDALPEIGHACGHNLIAAGALGAFLALHAERSALPGTVELVGTPAEEGGGGKITLLEAGVFRDVDAAMMFHPFDRDLLAHITLANSWVEMIFAGKSSHAALAPWDGKSALTACMETFRLIDGQRVHGIVAEGGVASNIVPERARAEFSVRALTTPELERVTQIVERCARAAAMACDVEVTIRRRKGYRHMNNNMTLARRFGDHLTALGRAPKERDPNVGSGSTDMGDVSHAVPSIHPWIQICETDETTCHQRQFAACADSRRGFDSMLAAAKAMAQTAADVLLDPSFALAVRREFDQASLG